MSGGVSGDPSGAGGVSGDGVDVGAWAGFFGTADVGAVAGSLAWFAREVATQFREIDATCTALAGCPSTAIGADLRISGQALARVVKELDTTAAACSHHAGDTR